MPGVDRLPDQVLDMLEKEYRKVLPALTVMSETETVKKLEAKIQEQAESLEQEKRKFESEKSSWEKRFEEIRAMIKDIERERKKELQVLAATSEPTKA